MPSIRALEAMAGLWDQEQCALFLRVTTVTLAKWRKNGTGPLWRIVGKRIIYIPDEVMVWLQKKKGRPAPSRPFGGKLERKGV